MKVIKRNGSEVEFDRVKIEMAIAKANASVEADQQIEQAVELLNRKPPRSKNLFQGGTCLCSPS